jgi:hypothetical protein
MNSDRNERKETPETLIIHDDPNVANPSHAVNHCHPLQHPVDEHGQNMS